MVLCIIALFSRLVCAPPYTHFFGILDEGVPEIGMRYTDQSLGPLPG